ncbi:hypothetical protein [Paraburkholderia flagellata]|uniref:hypothetical protein n=1 Tax=Paraburkholderia flagellata TaxID=2883241 RepID=UPI001F379FE8|nr:hypothetical protein [Paraburkholderia flagellata]
MFGDKRAAIAGKHRCMGKKSLERMPWIRRAGMRHEPDQRFGHCTVVSIRRAEMRSVLRNAGTGPLNGLFQRVTLQVNPRYTQMIAMIERSRWQLASEEGFEKGVVGEMVGRFHGSTQCSLNRTSIMKVTTVVGSSGISGIEAP